NVQGQGLSAHGSGERIETKHHEAAITGRAVALALKGHLDFGAGGRDADRTIEMTGRGGMKHVVTDDTNLVADAWSAQGSGHGEGVKTYLTNDFGWMYPKESAVTFVFDPQSKHWQVTTTFNYRVKASSEEHSTGSATVDGTSGSKSYNDIETDPTATDATSLAIDERNGKLERQGDRYVIEYKLDEHTTERPTSPSGGPKADNRTRNAVKNLPPIQGVSQTKTHEHHVSARIVIERVDQSEEMELTVVPVGHGSQGAVPYA